MEDLGTAYAVLLHDPQLRPALLIEHESSAKSREPARVRRRLLIWLARGLHGLGIRIEASVSSSTDTRPQQGLAIQALMSTSPAIAPVQPKGGS